MKEKIKKEDNYFLEKKYFYISELHFNDIPGDGYKLTSISDYKGPFQTLEKAQNSFKKNKTNYNRP